MALKVGPSPLVNAGKPIIRKRVKHGFKKNMGLKSGFINNHLVKHGNTMQHNHGHW